MPAWEGAYCLLASTIRLTTALQTPSLYTATSSSHNGGLQSATTERKRELRKEGREVPSRVRLREGPIGVRITLGQPTIGYLHPWVGFRPPAFVSLLSCSSSSCAIEVSNNTSCNTQVLEWASFYFCIISEVASQTLHGHTCMFLQDYSIMPPKPQC